MITVGQKTFRLDLFRSSLNGVLEIGFNVSYLLDALGAVTKETVVLELGDANSSCVIHPQDDQSCTYVIMPMRL